MSIKYRGLDLIDADVTTDEDIRGLREYNARTKGYTPASHEFWLDNRPDVFKRKILTILMADTDDTREHQARNLLSALHYYTVIGYGEGIIYEMRQARAAGASKGHVLDTLSIAYMHAHAHGMNVAADVSSEYIADWKDAEGGDGTQAAFPPEWSFDPDAFKSGLDFSNPHLTADERHLLEDWYLRTLGEIPGYVQFLADNRPDLLKAHRNRYENAIRNDLPKEMMPYLLLYFEVIRGFPDGIREQVLIARHFGMKKKYVVGAMCRAMTSYGGPTSISIAAKAAGDVLAQMD